MPEVVTEEEVREKEKDLHNETNNHVTFINRLYDSIKELEQNIQHLQEHLAEEQTARKQVEEDRESLKHTISELEEKAAAREEHIGELSTEIARLKKELDKDQGSLIRAIEDRDKQIALLLQQLSSQNVEIKSLHHLRSQVESFKIGLGHLKDPSHACVLPDESIVVADVERGLVLFSKFAELLQEVNSPDWKWPQGLVYSEKQQHIFVSIICRAGSGQKSPSTPTSGWQRGIGIFDLKLNVVKIIEGPQSTGFENVAKENLAVCEKTGDLYWSIADKLGSGVWKINLRKMEDLPVNESTASLWIEVAKKSGLVFSDFQIMPTPGPLTDVLVVEARKAYIYRWSLQDKTIAAQFNYAPVTNPSAIAVDERGVVFVHDTHTGKVYLLNSMNFETEKDVSLVEGEVSSITAHHGYLALSLRSAKQVTVCKYRDE